MVNRNLNWKSKEFINPNYSKAVIEIFDLSNSSFVDNWGFLISPNGFSLQIGNDMQNNKTMAGYVITRSSPSLGTMSLTGVFIDSLHVPERLRFMDFYDQYLQSNQNNYMEFVSKYKQKITVEGYSYEGLIQNVNISKSGNQQFLYQYTINFVVYSRKKVYNTESDRQISKYDMKVDMGVLNNSRGRSVDAQPQSQQLSASVAGILLGN